VKRELRSHSDAMPSCTYRVMDGGGCSATATTAAAGLQLEHILMPNTLLPAATIDLMLGADTFPAIPGGHSSKGEP